MATRPARKKPAARARARSGAPPAEPQKAPAPLAGADLLKAGLTALGGGHGRIFQTLLGIDAEGRPKELFKLPTFEDLFDERVARSLERLGVTRALVELRGRLAAIERRLERVERRLEAGKPAARARR